ncbi:MAG: tRNA (adenosine(37)-N6)-threonylcarbamoyltransferase complex ATPase subunit type 1 TsaE [Nitrospirae bacterium]|nr:tRNA (adenosine(37)-N6)-threonylcarbamoyltransferase complex ATPase subunit type 1 TsaE [Nitrospirota bacterium]
MSAAKGAKATAPAARRRATSSLPWKLTSSSHQQTDWLGQVLGRTFRGGETIALYGPLGAGKTALVRGIAQGLGASPTAVTSPTFVVIHEYQGRLPLAHMDWYRIRSLRELESTGVMEYFSGQTVTAIEWADKGLDLLPQDRIEVTLSHRTAQSRSIQLNATGPTSEDVLARARKTYQSPPHQSSDKKGTTRS